MSKPGITRPLNSLDVGTGTLDLGLAMPIPARAMIIASENSFKLDLE
jgi:hypothetical protein